MNNQQIKNKLLAGHVLDAIKTIPDNVIDCAITSPPYYCYDKDTEVLTINGWRNISTVKYGDLILTVNPMNNKLEYQDIIEVFSYDYNGELIYFKGENIDLKVTPNHCLYLKPFKLKSRELNGRWRNNKFSKYLLFRKAEDVKKHNKIPLRNFIWDGTKVDYFIIGEYKIPIDIWLEFFGWWISEGSVDGSCGGKNRGRVKIKQKKYWSEVKSLLSKMPFKYKIYNDSFEIYYLPLHDYLIQFGNSHTKFLPLEIKSLPGSKLMIFWISYMKGDGHKLKSSYSVSKQLNNDLQEVAIKIGLNSKIVNNYVHYKIDNFVRPKDFMTRVKYNDKVYCLTVRNHTLITRRNGTPIVSSNSQRFYGTELNTVWDSSNVDCNHEWETYTRPSNCWSVPGPGLYVGKQEYNKAWVKPQEQAYCKLCGAWYGQLGLEPTPMLYAKHLTDIFREVRRILKPTGLFFLNIGDTFAGSHSGHGQKTPNPKSLQSNFNGQFASSVMLPPAATCVGSEEWIKPKQLLLVPFIVAHSLQMDGWYLRRDIIWRKKSCLPSQVKDNFNGIYEHIFMFAKSPKYYFDQSKARMPYAPSTIMRYKYHQSVLGSHESGAKATGPEKAKDTPQTFVDLNPLGGVKGDVWDMNTANFKGKHWATFPYELVENCMLPGCAKEVCVKCGAPKLENFEFIDRKYEDLTDDEKLKWDKVSKLKNTKEEFKKILHDKILKKKNSLGYLQSCKCKDTSYEKGIVFDPFAGSGTTLIVAKRYGYYYCGVEMNSKYVKITEAQLSSMLS